MSNPLGRIEDNNSKCCLLSLLSTRSASHAVIAAIETSNYDEFVRLISKEQKQQNNAVDRDTVSFLLNKTVIAGSLEIARFLLDNTNADTEYVGEATGRTALIEAADRGCLELVKLLVKKKANIHAVSQAGFDHGMTALHLAIFNHHLPVVQFLCQDAEQVGRLVSAKTKFGANAVHVAAIYAYMDITHYLMWKTPVDVAARCSNGASLLHYFAANRWASLARRLVERHGVDICSLTNKGANCLHFFVNSNPYFPYGRETFSYLVETEPRLLVMPRDDGLTPIQLAERDHLPDSLYVKEMKKASKLLQGKN